MVNPFTARVLSDGTYSLKVPATEYWIAAAIECDNPASTTTVRVASGERAQVDLELFAVLRGTVLDYRGKPLPGAHIDYTLNQGKGPVQADRRGTDGGGRFCISAPEDGGITVMAGAPVNYPAMTRYPVTEAKFSTFPSAPITIQVASVNSVDLSLEGVEPGEVVTVTTQVDSKTGSTRESYKAREFSFYAEPGDLNIYAETESGLEGFASLAVKQGVHNHLKMVLTKGAMIRGRLMDENGQPIRDHSSIIVVHGLERHLSTVAERLQEHYTVIDSADSSFEVKGVAPGPYRLLFQSIGRYSGKWGRSAVKKVTVQSSEVLDVGAVVMHLNPEPSM
jgi:hypothetical protein